MNKLWRFMCADREVDIGRFSADYFQDQNVVQGIRMFFGAGEDKIPVFLDPEYVGVTVAKWCEENSKEVGSFFDNVGNVIWKISGEESYRVFKREIDGIADIGAAGLSEALSREVGNERSA